MPRIPASTLDALGKVALSWLERILRRRVSRLATTSSSSFSCNHLCHPSTSLHSFLAPYNCSSGHATLGSPCFCRSWTRFTHCCAALLSCREPWRPWLTGRCRSALRPSTEIPASTGATWTTTGTPRCPTTSSASLSTSGPMQQQPRPPRAVPATSCCREPYCYTIRPRALARRASPRPTSLTSCPAAPRPARRCPRWATTSTLRTWPSRPRPSHWTCTTIMVIASSSMPATTRYRMAICLAWKESLYSLPSRRPRAL